MKRIKLILSVFLCLIYMVGNISTFALQGGSTTNSDYVIDAYDIDIKVNENNTFEITENITAYFKTDRHGIYRKLPLKNIVERTDGTVTKNRAKISNISVNANYTNYKEDGYEVIKIGDSNRTIKGEYVYKIKYTYDIGKDPLKNADEFYYNLIGTEWDTTISNVTFKITMPKAFDKSLLGFSTGSKGAINSSAVDYSVDGNVISGTVKNTLQIGQGVTIRLNLPEGYFTNENTGGDLYSIVVIIVSLLCALIAYILWVKYGKDEEVIETVEFYPPEGYNSAEIGFLYDGAATNKSIISLLIYLADKGYLKIEETEKKTAFSKAKGFRIIKLKEYDGENENERIFFKGLFRNGKNVDMQSVQKLIKESKAEGKKLGYREAFEILADEDESKTAVEKSDLYNRFYSTIDTIQERLNSKENKNKIFESFAGGMGKWLYLIGIIIFIAITIKPLIEYEQFNEETFFILAMIVGGFSFMCTMLFKRESTIISKISGIFMGTMFGVIPWAIKIFPLIIDNNMYIAMNVVGIICSVLLILFSRIMSKRTPYGNEMLGKIRGFKRFLKTAEKEQLEALVEKNPEYFYNILPYTYALGVSDVWVKQFETMALQAPRWYDSPDEFSAVTFGNFMTSTMRSASAAMSSSPSSDGGSGGGPSGGGSGGGGGGSW